MPGETARLDEGMGECNGGGEMHVTARGGQVRGRAGMREGKTARRGRARARTTRVGGWVRQRDEDELVREMV